MGPTEEVGKATGLFFQIMKDQPLALALALMNLLLLMMFAYIAYLATANRRHEFEQILAAQKDVQQLLFQCNSTNPRG